MRDAALLAADRTFNVHPRPLVTPVCAGAGRDRSADLRVTRWAKDESEAARRRRGLRVVGRRRRGQQRGRRSRVHCRASSCRRPDPSAACLRRGQGAALGAGEMTLESEVFTGVSAGARVDARRTCQEPRLTDHARPHGSDLAFDLSIIASLARRPIAAPVPAAENPAMRDGRRLETRSDVQSAPAAAT